MLFRSTRGASTVRVVVRATGGGDLAVSVADEGDGIVAAHLPRLTERFYRVDTARSRQLGGTGLGLAIVISTVESLGGTIWVQPAREGGAAFVILLPLFPVARPPS